MAGTVHCDSADCACRDRAGILFHAQGAANHQSKIDLLSVAESTIGFGSLLYGFSSVGENGWTSPEVMITLAIGIIFVALFVYRQLHMDTPLLELRVSSHQSSPSP